MTARYGGLADSMPKYALFFMIFTMASVGLPGTSGFVGEFLSLTGSYQAHSWVAFVLTTGIVLGAAYMLYLYRRVVFGRLDKDDVRAMPDLSMREVALLAPIVGAVFWMGIYPETFLRPMRADVGAVLARIDRANPGGDAKLALGSLPATETRNEGAH
jgi:NADH-quinone oxidoreductase subunit M